LITYLLKYYKKAFVTIDKESQSHLYNRHLYRQNCHYFTHH